MPEAIRVQNLSFAYAQEQILEDLSFEIPKGGIVAIIGPNGSGKTTLLKNLLGILQPTKGEVMVFGAKPAQMRKKVGYVPQRFVFDHSFPITVLEFLKMSCPERADKKIADYLSHLGVEALPKARLGQLSGGQLQRVLVVRAMLQDPAILYLDEPASGIDIGGEHDFYQMVVHINREHATTVVMVSHEIDVVQGFASQVICINKKLVCSGRPEEALTPKVLRELYGSQAALYHHKEKQEHM